MERWSDGIKRQDCASYDCGFSLSENGATELPSSSAILRLRRSRSSSKRFFVGAVSSGLRDFGLPVFLHDKVGSAPASAADSIQRAVGQRALNLVIFDVEE